MTSPGQHIEVDHATLHTAANDVRSTKAEVEGELRKLWSVVDDLAIAWLGQASGGFQTLINRWNEDAGKLLTAMDNIGDLLDKSGTQHQATDEEQSQVLDKIHSALNPG
jgi:WXG100 family type VII secretion target